MQVLPSSIQLQFAPFPTECAADGLVDLSGDEQTFAQTLKSDKRKSSFIAGRRLIRSMLADQLAVSRPDVPLRVEPSGVVSLDATPRRFLSISHSADEIAAAIAPFPVGIDLEAVQPRRAEVWRFILHPDEYAAFHALDLPMTEKTILYWVMKESVLKGMGTGFRFSPKRLYTRLHDSLRSAIVRTDDPAHPAQTWSLFLDRRPMDWFALAWLSETDHSS